MSSNPFHASPTPAAKQAIYRGFGKENGPLENSTTSEARRAPVAPHGYPGHVFQDSYSNPLHSYNQYFRAYQYPMPFGDNRSPGEYGPAGMGDYRTMNPMAARSMQPQGQQSLTDNNNAESSNPHYPM